MLFLWVPQPMLDFAIVRVMPAWGFAYRTCAVWEKDRIGTGYWFRDVNEILIVATRGNVVAPAMGDQALSRIDAPAGRHSEKPEAVAEMIERLYPNVPKLKMFARKPRDGWDVWGNEVVE